MEPALLWVDPPSIGKPGAEPIVLRYPDGSTCRARHAFINGVCELVYRPEGYPDGKHVAVETFADVHLDEHAVDGRYYAARLREAVLRACDRLEQAGHPWLADELREAATLAGFPPASRNPLA